MALTERGLSSNDACKTLMRNCEEIKAREGVILLNSAFGVVSDDAGVRCEIHKGRSEAGQRINIAREH